MSEFRTVLVSSWFGEVHHCPDLGHPPRQPPAHVLRDLPAYYRELEESAESFTAEGDLDGEFDYWHYHADWVGVGNLSWDDRQRHLAAQQTIFRRLLAQLTARGSGLHCWWEIHPLDSSSDAIYLHSPALEVSPINYEDIDWSAAIPERLKVYVAEPGWLFGRQEAARTAFYVWGYPQGRASRRT